MTTGTPAGLIDAERRLVSRRIFIDEDIYQAELERVFARCWLFLGHESQVAQPGDYFTNYMGEDPVIVCRDAQGRVRAFLNSCRHRGMKVCRSDRGNARTFTCPFHGWSYDTSGSLVGVPYHREAYGGQLDRQAWALKEVPRVTSYGGFVFGCWDAGAGSLDDYLGDFRWYLDITIERALGGWQVIEGMQRYSQVANWKLAAENFAGDCYHLPFSHGSVYRLPIRQISNVTYTSAPTLANVRTAHGHGFTGLAWRGERHAADLAEAEGLGPEVADYVRACHARLDSRLSPLQRDIFALGFGNVFPNFSHNNFSALRPLGLYLWHPKGPQALEAWQWCAIDRDAPEALRRMIRADFTRTQATTGLAAQDDTENFEQVTEATRGAIGRTLDFNYQMAMDMQPSEVPTGAPGAFAPYYSEHNQHNFYVEWQRRMAEGDAEAAR